MVTVDEYDGCEDGGHAAGGIIEKREGTRRIETKKRGWWRSLLMTMVVVRTAVAGTTMGEDGGREENGERHTQRRKRKGRRWMLCIYITAPALRLKYLNYPWCLYCVQKFVSYHSSKTLMPMR